MWLNQLNNNLFGQIELKGIDRCTERIRIFTFALMITLQKQLKLENILNIICCFGKLFFIIFPWNRSHWKQNFLCKIWNYIICLSFALNILLAINCLQLKKRSFCDINNSS